MPRAMSFRSAAALAAFRHVAAEGFQVRDIFYARGVNLILEE